jgi:hypothetical protein
MADVVGEDTIASVVVDVDVVSFLITLVTVTLSAYIFGKAVISAGSGMLRENNTALAIPQPPAAYTPAQIPPSPAQVPPCQTLAKHRVPHSSSTIQ